MTETPEIPVLVGPANAPDVALRDCQDLSELRDEMRFALEDGQSLVIDLSTTAGTPIAPGEAARQLRRLLDEGAPVALTVHVSNDRAAQIVRDCLSDRASVSRHATFGNLKVEVTTASITEVSADAAVNASNTRLELGGGVSRVLRLAAGPRLQAAMSPHAPIGKGDIVETPAFDHRSVRSILHVPTAGGGQEVIACAYANVIRVAQQKGHRRVALPSLGTGTGRLNPHVGAELLREALEAAAEGPAVLLILALFALPLADVFAEVLGAE